MAAKNSQPTLLSDILKKYQPVDDSAKYISREFQDFAYRLATELGDLAHTPLYMRLAKTTDRRILEAARSFAVDAEHATSRARLFMWKVKELKKLSASSK